MNIDDLISVPSRAKAAWLDRLHPRWRDMLRYAWSIRLGLIAAFFNGAAVLTGAFIANPPFAPFWFALLAAFFTGAAMLSQFYMQQNMRVKE